MNRLPFKPEFWPTVMTLVMFVTIVGLGVWQMQRLAWKEGLVAEINRQAAMEAAPLEDALEGLDAYQYRRVIVKGEFLHEKELHMAGKYERNTLGYHVVTPMRLESGKVVLVNRGWVPKEQRDRETRPETLVKGTQVLEGMVHGSRGKGLFTPDNGPEKNMWFWYDLEAMAQATGQALLPVVVDALRGEGQTGLPLAATGIIELRNDHLAYAITWFCLAAGLVAVYVIYHLQRRPQHG